MEYSPPAQKNPSGEVWNIYTSAAAANYRKHNDPREWETHLLLKRIHPRNDDIFISAFVNITITRRMEHSRPAQKYSSKWIEKRIRNLVMNRKKKRHTHKICVLGDCFIFAFLVFAHHFLQHHHVMSSQTILSLFLRRKNSRKVYQLRPDYPRRARNPQSTHHMITKERMRSTHVNNAARSESNTTLTIWSIPFPKYSPHD